VGSSCSEECCVEDIVAHFSVRLSEPRLRIRHGSIDLAVSLLFPFLMHSSLLFCHENLDIFRQLRQLRLDDKAQPRTRFHVPLYMIRLYPTCVAEFRSPSSARAGNPENSSLLSGKGVSLCRGEIAYELPNGIRSQS